MLSLLTVFGDPREQRPAAALKLYHLDTLSYQCKAQLASLQFVEQELERLQAQAAVLQTDKAAYLQALKKSLTVLGESDTIKLS